MANEQQKKPPAHEVIVELLRQYADAVQRESRDASHNPETAASLVEIEQRLRTLLTVLMRMHIPEKDRPWVVSALKQLPLHFFPPMIVDVFAELEGDKGGA